MISRLKQKSPKYFQVFNTINMIMFGIGAIPTLLKELDIVLPDRWMVVVGRLVSIAGLWGYLMSKSTVQRDPIIINEQGQVVEKPKEVALPYTIKTEQKEQEKKSLDFSTPAAPGDKGINH